jgi:uncharacterized cupredoxin-like copper-binding protein
VRTRIVLAATIGVLGLVAAACGGSDSNGSNATGDDVRSIEIEMRDTAFAPNSITVAAGEEVRLVFHNTGKVDHDAFIGDEMAQADHEEEMRDDGGMHHDGGDSDAVTVEPGETGTLTHTFKEGERALIGCHQPGHFAAGMKIKVTTS